MVIQDLKPSNRVDGCWLVMLEDGSILRVGENEVIEFADVIRDAQVLSKHK